MSNAEGRKAVTRSGNYQDNVIAPLTCEHDNDAIDDNDSEEIVAPDADAADGVLPAVERVGDFLS